TEQARRDLGVVIVLLTGLESFPTAVGFCRKGSGSAERGQATKFDGSEKGYADRSQMVTN
ncbi:MAG: hypothetical protein KDN19_23780, partial [Verrucomicrobiae bacterium]|nr:hypothetical protein [Verrucomicrobiae bacterium]